jgi:hypothetical protein
LLKDTIAAEAEALKRRLAEEAESLKALLAQVLSLLALLAQNYWYKYWRRRLRALTRCSLRCLVYLLYCGTKVQIRSLKALLAQEEEAANKAFAELVQKYLLYWYKSTTDALKRYSRA